MRHASKLLFALSMLWAILLLALGSWWAYLIVRLGQGDLPPNLGRMLLWEGSSFLVLLLLLSATLVFLYWKDYKKTKGLQAFFASLTHELKTPLASIRLQADVLAEQAGSQAPAARLVEDVLKLELQMDKILQLSRVELGGNLNVVPVDLLAAVRKQARNLGALERTHIESEGQESWILADELALQLIFKNLLENSTRHAPGTPVHVKLEKQGDQYVLYWKDGGRFSGERARLGELFYKHRSTNGSGIGLYLIRRLMDRMGGSWRVLEASGLLHELRFKYTEGPK